MTTPDAALWAVCFVAGTAFAGAYVGLLWAAIRALAQAARPVPVFVGLAAARAVLMVAALALAIRLGTGADGILAGLAGFLVVRAVATRRIDPRRRETP